MSPIVLAVVVVLLVVVGVWVVSQMTLDAMIKNVLYLILLLILVVALLHAAGIAL